MNAQIANNKINVLKLQIYDNVSRLSNRASQDEVSEEDTAHFSCKKNFVEFYIDGKCLINKIGRKFWNKENSESFFDTHIGYLGYFNEETDLIFISLILMFDSEEEIARFIYPFVTSDEKVKLILAEIELEKEKLITLYGCPCGDTDCGGIGVEIERNKYFIYWYFGEIGNRLSYKFDSHEYEQELKSFLKANRNY